MLAFQEGQSIFLLTMASGAYRQAVHADAAHYYSRRTWLDNSHLYLAVLAVGTETPPLRLALLDSSTDTVQPVFASPALCGDFDHSSNGTRLFTSDAADEGTGFPFTHSPWSVVSRDGRSFAILKYTYALATPGPLPPLVSTSLLVGSVSGGPPVAFVTLIRRSSTIDTIDLVGWTTM